MRQTTLATLLAAAVCLPLAAQENWCSNQGWHNSDMVTHSEVREERLATAAVVMVNPGQNGSIRVHGGGSSDIQVKACVQTSAHDDGTAQALAQQVTITDGAGRVVAKGPASTGGQSWWSVSYDIWVPSSSKLDLHAYNVSIHVEGTSGHIQARTLNGSMTLKDVIGDVDGETTNGSLSIDLIAGNSAQGMGLKLKTVNGSIHLQLPATISADVEASTVNGSVKNDFATAPVDSKEKHNLKFTLGAGGPKIDAETVNGSVRISRQS